MHTCISIYITQILSIRTITIHVIIWVVGKDPNLLILFDMVLLQIYYLYLPKRKNEASHMEILQDSGIIKMYIATYSSVVCLVIELFTKAKNLDF